MSITFLLTSFVIVALPGTGALLTVSAGLSNGTRASIVTAIGCTLGIVPHMAAALTGTAALLQASGAAFEVFKGLGVAYLLYMAWSTWRDHTPLAAEAVAAQRSPSRVIGSAVTANLLNPKLTLFFFAFLPQFTPAHSAHRLADMLLFSGVFMAMTLIVFAAGARRYVIERPEIVRRLRQAFALSFVALSAKLASEAR